MYEPRNPKTRRSLKGRSAVFVSKPFLPVPFWQKNGWLSLVTLGTTVVPPRVVPRIFTYIKKLIRYPKTRSRFWVNAQCAFLVTRKPLNVRMGKGKGAKVRLYTRISHATPLAAISSLRSGFKKRLKRFASIRLGRRVSILEPLLGFKGVEWAQRHRTQTNFLRARAAEVKTLLGFIRRPSMKFFFGKLFRAAWRRPRLRWRSRWPLLPRVSARLKARRKKWGSGSRLASPIWAGLASLMAGVRKVSSKATPAKSTKKLLGQELRGLFLKSRSSFYRAKSLTALKKVSDLKNSALYKALRSGVLKKGPTLFPKSSLLVPFDNSLTPLLGVWKKLGLGLSEREASFFASTGGPSLLALIKTVSILEKTSIVVYGTTKASTKRNQALVEGPLALLKGDNSQGASPASPSEGGGLVLNYIVEDGFMELWPSVDLRPMVLTLVVFNPSVCFV